LGYNSENRNAQHSIALAQELQKHSNSTAIYDSDSFKQKYCYSEPRQQPQIALVIRIVKFKVICCSLGQCQMRTASSAKTHSRPAEKGKVSVNHYMFMTFLHTYMNAIPSMRLWQT